VGIFSIQGVGVEGTDPEAIIQCSSIKLIQGLELQQATPRRREDFSSGYSI